jgi:hypothetical protein
MHRQGWQLGAGALPAQTGLHADYARNVHSSAHAQRDHDAG